MTIIKKRMPFTLVLDGQQINTIEELREHPSTELLDRQHDGGLGSWLREHGCKDEAAQLDELKLGDNKAKDLAFICGVLGMDVDIDDIKAVMAEQDQKTVPVASQDTGTQLAIIHTPADDASTFLIKEAKGRLTHFLEKLKRARRQISSSDFRTTNKPFTDSCGGEVVLFRNMGTVRAQGVMGEDFETGVTSLFQSCDEINIERLHSDFIVADGVKNFTVKELVTRYAFIRADNVYIGSLYDDELDREERMELFVIANNIFIGESNAGFLFNSSANIQYTPVTFLCRDKFLFGFDFPLDDIPFEKNQSEITLHMQKLSAEAQVANDEFRNSTLGLGLALIGGCIGLLSGGLGSQDRKKTFMKDGFVYARQYLTDPDNIPMTAHPESITQIVYYELTSMFSEWAKNEKVFSKRFWIN